VTLITSITGSFNLSIDIFVLVLVVVDQPVSGVQSDPFYFDAHVKAAASETAGHRFLNAVEEKHSEVLGEMLHEVLRVSQPPAATNTTRNIGKRPDHLDEADLVGEGLTSASISLLVLSQEAREDSHMLEVTFELSLDFGQVLFHELDELRRLVTSHDPEGIAHAGQSQHALDSVTETLGVAVERLVVHAGSEQSRAVHSHMKRLTMMV